MGLLTRTTSTPTTTSSRSPTSRKRLRPGGEHANLRSDVRREITRSRPHPNPLPKGEGTDEPVPPTRPKVHKLRGRGNQDVRPLGEAAQPARTGRPGGDVSTVIGKRRVGLDVKHEGREPKLTAGEMLACAQLAEQQGFDSFWTNEDIAYDSIAVLFHRPPNPLHRPGHGHRQRLQPLRAADRHGHRHAGRALRRPRHPRLECRPPSLE